MTDTKEPTPLTAASLANIELEIKAREGNGETRQDDPLFLRLLATIAELQREIDGLREHDTSVTAKLKDVTEVLDWFSSVAVGQEDESLWQFVASLIWDRYYARQLYAAAERINELRKKQLEGYRRALVNYGTHKSGCTWWKAYSNKPECSCGFELVLAGKEAQR